MIRGENSNRISIDMLEGQRASETRHRVRQSIFDVLWAYGPVPQSKLIIMVVTRTGVDRDEVVGVMNEMRGKSLETAVIGGEEVIRRCQRCPRCAGGPIHDGP